MVNKVQIYVFSVSFLWSLLAPTSAKSPLFIFGDSLLDVGNNNYINTSTSAQANFWPYGITFFNSPTGRFSDGRIISDFIAEYAMLIINIRRAFNANELNLQAIDLHMQLRNFKKVIDLWRDMFGDSETKKRLTSAVYLFSTGANDYLSLFLSTSSFLSSYTKSQYVEMVIGNITSVITEIYKAGGRKFAFLAVPNIGCVPMLRITTANGECNTEPSNYVLLHKEALFRALEQLEKQLPGFKHSLYDLDTGLQQRIDYPSKYGFKEGKIACCGTGRFRGIFSCGGTRFVREYELCENVNDYVFWDSVHLTEKAYKQIADEMWNHSSYGSYNIKDLFHKQSNNVLDKFV